MAKLKFIKSARYRIVEYLHVKNLTYCLEKKVWWIPFWYNPDNVDACTTGYYPSYEKAYEAYIAKITPTKKTVTSIGVQSG